MRNFNELRQELEEWLATQEEKDKYNIAIDFLEWKEININY